MGASLEQGICQPTQSPAPFLLLTFIVQKLFVYWNLKSACHQLGVQPSSSSSSSSLSCHLCCISLSEAVVCAFPSCSPAGAIYRSRTNCRLFSTSCILCSKCRRGADCPGLLKAVGGLGKWAKVAASLVEAREEQGGCENA